MEGKLVIPKLFDAHVHFRQGQMLKLVAPMTARQCSAAIVMPNTKPPITTTIQASEYREEILTAVKESGVGTPFTPLMTLYLTDNTDPDEVRKGFESGVVTAAKLYPAGATTNSDEGVTNIEKIDPVLTVMEELGMPLCIHCETLAYPDGSEVDVFAREEVGIFDMLQPILEAFPNLPVVFEHITTRKAVEFVRAKARVRGNIAATITAHHLMMTRNDLFRGGIRPHYYCLPIAKLEDDRQALRGAMVSDEPWFFAGTDSAPHDVRQKETACGCAGIFTAHAAAELYTQVFDEEHVLHYPGKIMGFTSVYGKQFYRLSAKFDVPDNETMRLKTRPWTPKNLVRGGISVTPFRYGETIEWQMVRE